MKEFTYLGIRFKPYGKCLNLPKDVNEHFKAITHRCILLRSGDIFKGWSHEAFYEAAKSEMDTFLLPDYYNFPVIPVTYRADYYAPEPEDMDAYEAWSAYALRCLVPITSKKDPKGNSAKYYICREDDKTGGSPLVAETEAMYFGSESTAREYLRNLPEYIKRSCFEPERITLFEQITLGILHEVDKALGRPPLKTQKELRDLEENTLSSDRPECGRYIGKPYSVLREILTVNPLGPRMLEIEFEDSYRMRVYPDEIGGR